MEVEQFELERCNGVYTLKAKKGGKTQVMTFPVEIARNLRTLLEACVSGRRKQGVATASQNPYPKIKTDERPDMLGTYHSP